MPSWFHCFGINAKSMVLRGDLAFTGDDIFYRVVQSAVAVVHFKSRNIIGQSQQLVTQTNTEQRFFFLQNVFHGSTA